jgi:nucleoside 2-deoxyribosyltransferase
MTKNTFEDTNSSPYVVYSAGGLFTQDELSMNVLLKEAVWRLSNGRFQLFLPQSREVQELNMGDIEAHIRNTDILEVVKADILLGRFDGPDLDSGTVIEFATAKFLGKPTVILRSDFRRMVFIGAEGPYNSMVKNWPRTVEIQPHSFKIWGELLADECQKIANNDALQDLMNAELGTLKKSVDEIAKQVIGGFETVITMESPYPPEYQEAVYQALRYSLGSGFSDLLTKSELEKIIQRLRNNRSL